MFRHFKSLSIRLNLKSLCQDEVLQLKTLKKENYRSAEAKCGEKRSDLKTKLDVVFDHNHS